jgi:hypothetical protein
MLLLQHLDKTAFQPSCQPLPLRPLPSCLADIATPYMATRCQVPVKIAADHQELDALLDRFETALKKLLASDHPSVQRVLCTATQVGLREGCPCAALFAVLCFAVLCFAVLCCAATYMSVGAWHGLTPAPNLCRLPSKSCVRCSSLICVRKRRRPCP